MSWDAELYLKFGAERTRPSIDLASRVDVAAPARVVDLGCGPGNSTQVLRGRWPSAEVTGLDNSAEMIAAAREKYPDQQWVLGDAGTWSADRPFDVVFSNAAIQWIPHHDALVTHLFDQVAEGGALAFQIPSPVYADIHTLIHHIAADERWSARMQGPMTELTMREPAFYYDVLCNVARSLDIWETEYQHVMESPAAIVEWISSTGLRPFLAALDDEADRAAFTEMLTERAVEAYPSRADGKVLFGFRRLFVVAYR